MTIQELNTKFDLDKALDGNRNIVVSGIPDTDGRRGLIENAINSIQLEPETAFSKEYIGFKNYAGFGDQQVRCRYGTGPRHGFVVFQIGRRSGKRNESKLGENEIYLLECVRDFGSVEVTETRSGYRNQTRKLNFCDVLNRLERILREYDEVLVWIRDFEPESYVLSN